MSRDGEVLFQAVPVGECPALLVLVQTCSAHPALISGPPSRWRIRLTLPSRPEDPVHFYTESEVCQGFESHGFGCELMKIRKIF